MIVRYQFTASALMNIESLWTASFSTNYCFVTSDFPTKFQCKILVFLFEIEQNIQHQSLNHYIYIYIYIDIFHIFTKNMEIYITRHLRSLPTLTLHTQIHTYYHYFRRLIFYRKYISRYHMTIFVSMWLVLGPISRTFFFQIRWKIHFAFIQILRKRSLRNFAHDTAAVCCAMASRNVITAKRNFNRFCIVMKKSLVKWDHVSESHLTTEFSLLHYCGVIMGAMASQITSLTIVYSTVYSGADQRKHQSSASLAFVRGIHRWLVNSPHKWPVTRKMFPFDNVIMI